MTKCQEKLPIYSKKLAKKPKKLNLLLDFKEDAQWDRYDILKVKNFKPNKPPNFLLEAYFNTLYGTTFWNANLREKQLNFFSFQGWY